MTTIAGLSKGWKRWRVAILGVGLLLTLGFATRAEEQGRRSSKVEFNRDIRPILSDACFRCHGPDRAKRKANLRLDVEADAFAERDGSRAFVAGDVEQSSVYQRLISDDPDERMPPPGAPRTLSPEEIERIRTWIADGANWQPHWSLIPPVRTAAPVVKAGDWRRGAIDGYVLAALERINLSPSPEADRATLLRRVTLDLTGLPPTPDEVDRFLVDQAPDAYEKVVDRLLASPRFGERMAIRWLDAARYADTNGYQTDGERQMWRWRDWVIEAWNANLSFDRFTVEQLAGDMLPNASLAQKLASGFNRNHRGNSEGGIIPEEYAVEYVVDRVDTTATVWLGLTMACARCHDHKYDPITQRDFYQVYAFFNNVPEQGRAIKIGNSPPMVTTPTRQQEAELAALNRRVTQAELRERAIDPELQAAQSAWEQTLRGTPPITWNLSEGLIAHYGLDGDLLDKVESARTPQVVQGDAHYVTGRIGAALEFDGVRSVDAGDVAGFGFFDKFSIAAWVAPEGRSSGTVVSRMADMEEGEGYSLVLDSGRVQVNLSKRWLDDALRVRTKRALPTGEWHHVLVTYDGTRLASGVSIFVDGKIEPTDTLLDELNQTFQTKEPLRIGGGNGPKGRFRGRLDDVRIYDRRLSAEEAAQVAVADTIQSIAATACETRTPGQSAKLREYFLEHGAPKVVREALRQSRAIRAERDIFVERLPNTMVMQELPAPRPTFLLKRGEYDKPGDRVLPRVPACLPPLPTGARADRLAFARWLVDPANPLTARVMVNRTWQMLFGTGLVKTVDDLGSQGEQPTNPDLLDWLATEFVGSGWNMKHLLRTIVISATYRQSSKTSPELLRKDPENRLLARGPRIRLSAEMIRDQALAVSGLLTEQLGGPSVKPYQPAGLWRELTDADYVQDHGARLYRRSLYTFWKRTVSPPVMQTFDASARETCVVRETRTNTPLQALTLLNDVTFVEAARALAERSIREGGATPKERITRAFRLVTARQPSARELAVLVNGLHAHLIHFRAHPDRARELAAAGEAPRDRTLDEVEVAAYAAVASLILNLDEAITKE